MSETIFVQLMGTVVVTAGSIVELNVVMPFSVYKKKIQNELLIVFLKISEIRCQLAFSVSSIDR